MGLGGGVEECRFYRRDEVIVDVGMVERSDKGRRFQSVVVVAEKWAREWSRRLQEDEK